MTGTFACIAGGGTGGHVLPGLAIAEALVDAGHDRDTIRFVGSSHGPDTTLVPAAGFALDTVAGRGIPRRVSLGQRGGRGQHRARAWVGHRR